MKIGRNDPCPCGSGKKYKRCCLKKEQELQRQEREKKAEQVKAQSKEQFKASPKPLDPRIQAFDKRYDAFMAADYEGKINLYQQTLKEPEIMDGEMAFEMLNTLHDLSVEHGEKERFFAWRRELKEALPEVYEEESHYFLECEISDLITMDRASEVRELIFELVAKEGDRHLNNFTNVIDQLAYNGQLDLVNEAMPLAIPSFRESSMFDWVIDEYVVRTGNFVILHYFINQPKPSSKDSKLLKKLSSYHAMIDVQYLKGHLSHLGGQRASDWSEDFFADGVEDLQYLSLVFVSYAHTKAQIPYSKAELARYSLVSYLLERFNGELKTKGKYPLCPDSKSLYNFLNKRFQLDHHEFYQAIAWLELLPLWLDFLLAQELITEEMRENSFNEMVKAKKQNPNIFNFMERFKDDPIAIEVVKSFPRTF